MTAQTASSSLPMRAYVVSQFPEFCETFVLNEMIELEKRGVPFKVFSLKSCRDTQFQPGAREIMDRATFYAPHPLHPGHLLANLRSIFTGPGRYLATLALAFRARRGGIAVLIKTLYVFYIAAWFARIARREGVHHIHAHWASIPSSGGLCIARLAGIEFSLTAHAYDIFIDRTLLREKIQEARYLVTCTEYNKRFLLKTYPDVAPGKVEAVYHGTDMDVFARDHNVAAEKPVMLSVGRLCDTKGFPELIEACRLLREKGLDFECRIVGDGYMRDALETQIRDAGLTGQVRILGLMPREKVIEEYSQARLFVLPCVITARGDRDGLPNVIVEAMAMGLPVVGSEVSGLPEAIHHGETGLLVPPENPPALAAALEKLWNDAALRRTMGEAAAQKARATFSLRENMEKLARLTREKSCD